eukprot:GHVR01047085.1.p1 GENE.GHVR01047085.1~~GHVR01047085.1.p1  ORF type:complete len:106 (-),score=26.13 GHVR01047085.1:8-325(-)
MCINYGVKDVMCECTRKKGCLGCYSGLGWLTDEFHIYNDILYICNSYVISYEYLLLLYGAPPQPLSCGSACQMCVCVCVCVSHLIHRHTHTHNIIYLYCVYYKYL